MIQNNVLAIILRQISLSRGLKDMESDISSIEKRFAYGFLQKLLKWMDIAQEFIAHLGTADCYALLDTFIDELRLI